LSEKISSPGVGIKNGLTLYLDAHTQTSLYKRGKNTDRTFTLTLQHYDNFPLAALSGLTVKAGPNDIKLFEAVI